MCVGAVGMAIGQFVISAASSVMAYQQQATQAEAQNEYYENNRREANQAAVNTYASQQNRALQEQKAASQQKQEVAVEGLKARSTAEVAAGESGVSGLSVDALVGDFYGQQGRYERTLDNNYAMQSDYLRGEMDATQSQAQGRINSVQQAQKPSFAGAAIRILGAGLDAFGSYKQNKQYYT